MSVEVATGPHHTYRAPGHDIVLSEVCTVLCVLLPRAFLVAGLSEAGEVILARYNSYDAELPEWETSFFEHELMTEKLFGVPEQVKTVFIGPEASMLIPSALYTEKDARQWLTELYSACPDDAVHNTPAPSAGAQFAFALPARMEKLLHRYFGSTPILPVAAYQLYKPSVAAHHLLQCLITQDTVIASLHQAGALQWHQSFPYQTVEDIAWMLAHLCRELHIPRIDLQLECALLCDTCFDLIPELERYFPKIKWAAGAAKDAGKWAPVVYLLQQLYVCAL